MAPRRLGHQADPGDHLRQDGVGCHHFVAFTFGHLAQNGAFITGGVDQKSRPHGAEVIE